MVRHNDKALLNRRDIRPVFGQDLQDLQDWVPHLVNPVNPVQSSNFDFGG
jgi:hypothetical protein